MMSSAYISSSTIVVVSVVLFISFAAASLFDVKKRSMLLHRLGVSRYLSSDPKSPTQSSITGISTHSKTGIEFAATPPGLVDISPPSIKEIVAKQSSVEDDQAVFSSIVKKTAVALTRRNVLPMTRSYYLPNPQPLCTPTGLSTEEIKSLGRFPRYDVLSGVPLPEPYANFNINRALPRPYRPFRFPYHQTMSLTKLDPNWYLELHSNYTTQIAQRLSLFRLHGPSILSYLPGSDLACRELMEICLQFYTHRWPSLFTLSSDNLTFHNHILNTTTNLAITHPLHVLLRNIPSDFAIVQRSDTDGEYYFRAGVICSSLGWNVASKLGMNLKQIHTGIVPDYKEKMSFSMDRFFSRMACDAPITRGSWGLEVGEVLYMPPGDPHEALRKKQDPELKVDDIMLRVDWQTLRRLPLSGSVVFGFEALFTPVSEFRMEKGVPALLARVLREGKKSFMEYKGTWHVEHVLLPVLDEWAKEQIESGLVDEEWEVETLKESPFFEGWEEKWLMQQGRD